MAPALILLLVLSLAPAVSLSAGERRVSVTEFGASGEGRTFSTEAIQRAIDSVAQSGGGTVVIPEGVFTSGALFLKPGVGLHLEKGAVLRGSTRLDDYPRTLTRIEGHFETWRPALLNAIRTDHLRITGEGTIEGCGQPFWQEFWRRRGSNPAVTNLAVERPRLVHVAYSNDVVIRGIKLRDSAFWNLHLYRCRDVLVDGVDIQAPMGAPSSDGIDIDSCQDVTVRRSFISVDDDCIALKGSKGPRALEDTDSPPVERIRVEDCQFALGGGVVTLGSEATVVRDVRVARIRVSSPTALRRISLVRLKLRPDTPQTYEDIHFDDVVLDGVGRLFGVAPWTQFFDLQGQPAPSAVVRNLTLSNVRGSFERFGMIRGHERVSFGAITLQDVDVQLEDSALDLDPRVELAVKNVRVNGAAWQPPR